MEKTWRKYFVEDRYVLILIALNAFILFLLSFPSLDAYSLWFELIDLLFLIYFGIEAMIKIQLLGWKRYISRGWNKFDFALVVISVPTVLVLIKGDWSDLALFFLLRTVRVARFFKFLRFVPNIQELIAGVRRAFKASVFVLLAFTVYCFVIALVSCRLFHRLEPELFGDPIKAFYYIFQVFTIEGWNEIPERIIQTGNVVAPLTYAIKLYFMVIVTTGGLFGLSIVNAIFVEEMVRDNNDDLNRAVLELNRKVDVLLENVKSDNVSEENL
ncbi:MAG: ion transporter [Bacteroidia bacterium]|nr:ion transporter [Bacteroidia bacterium]